MRPAERRQHDVSDDDRRLGAVRDRLLERYLGFAFGGLHIAARDISAEIAEARRMMTEFLGRELRWPDRPPRLLHLSLVADGSGELVGKATREVGLRGSALVVAHTQLRILAPESGGGGGSGPRCWRPIASGTGSARSSPS